MWRDGHGWISVHLTARKVDSQHPCSQRGENLLGILHGESCRKWNYICGSSVPLVQVHLQV